MGVEIERKFLLKNADWRPLVEASHRLRQGYLVSDEVRSVRVRIYDNQAHLNIKSATLGSQRSEYEYAIPVADAEELLAELCAQPLLEKTRHLVKAHGLTWEIDEFWGENAGLIVAEIELAAADQEIELPPWVGQEVTEERRYYNAALIHYPYAAWSSEER